MALRERGPLGFARVFFRRTCRVQRSSRFLPSQPRSHALQRSVDWRFSLNQLGDRSATPWSSLGRFGGSEDGPGTAAALGECRLSLRSSSVGCLVLAAWAGFFCGAASGAEPQCGFFGVDEQDLYACEQGVGPPVVVLEAGMRETSGTWSQVAPRLAEVARVITYDRAGLGRSASGPIPRTSGRIARELRALLTELRVQGPFVLVGHSIGGWHARSFAEAFPAEVAAVVLLDSPHEGFEARRRALFSAAEREERDRLIEESRRELSVGVRREYEGLEESRGEFRGRLPEVPLWVVSAEHHRWQHPHHASKLDAAWLELQGDLAEQSQLGKLIVLEGAGHNVHREDPDQIVGLLKRLLASLSPRKPAP